LVWFKNQRNNTIYLLDNDVTYLASTPAQNETLRLLSFLNKEVMIKNQEESNDEYLKRIYNFFDFNILWLAVGLESNNTKALETYFDYFIESLSEKEITLEDIYNFNLFHDYLRANDELIFMHINKIITIMNYIVVQKKE